MTKSVCLAIVFNHRYDKNIEKLKKIYSSRFSNIRFLMPFYDGTDQQVIPVFESSYQFQGFLIQSYEKLININVDYYVYVADDMIINPMLNEDNIISYLGLEDKKVGISKIEQLNKPNRLLAWNHTLKSSCPFLKSGTEWVGNLPTYKDALEKFDNFFCERYKTKYGLDFLGIKNITPNKFLRCVKTLLLFLYYNNRSLDIPYPLAMGYSDIFVLHKDVLSDVAYVNGLFSSMNMFVEIAIPTSVVLCVERDIVLFFEDNIDLKTKVMWDSKEVKSFSEKANYDYHKLCEIWDKKTIFAHPIKLSKWTV